MLYILWVWTNVWHPSIIRILYRVSSLNYFAFLSFSNPIILCLCAKLLQLCLTLCNSMDCSPPGSSVHGISQTRVLERITIFSSRWSSQPRDQTSISYVAYIGRQAGSVPVVPPEKPPSCCEFLGNGFQWLRLLSMGLTKPASLVGAGWHFH